MSTTGTVKPGPACGVLKQFFRLLRVTVENRKASALCPAVASLCASADLRPLVIHPALSDELAPAYFGVIYQLLTVHWKQFVVSAPPDASGVRVRTFYNEEAARTFGQVMDVILATMCTPDVSPSLLKLLLKLLTMMDKVRNVFALELPRLSRNCVLLLCLCDVSAHTAVHIQWVCARVSTKVFIRPGCGQC